MFLAVSVPVLGLMDSAESLGKALLGKSVAFSGPLGCCGNAYDSQQLEYPQEVRATWRALLLPHQERASHPEGDGGLLPQHSFGSRGIVCHVRFAHDGRDVRMDEIGGGIWGAQCWWDTANEAGWSTSILKTGSLRGARVALSCHLALDLLWQEIQEAWLCCIAAIFVASCCCVGALLQSWKGCNSVESDVMGEYRG